MSGTLVWQDHILTYPGYPGWAPNIPNLFGDSSYYALRGYWMALDWKQVALSDKVLRSAYNPIYGWHGYSYIVALYHYIFGFSPVSTALMNCLFGALLAILSYFIARMFLTEMVSRLFAVIVAFFPSLFFWSTTNLKDIPVILLTFFIFWSFLCFYKSQGRKRIKFLLFLLFGLLIQAKFRIFLMPLTALSIIISYFIIANKPKGALRVMGFVIFLSILVLIAFRKVDFKKLDTFFRYKIFRALSIHQAGALDKGSNYRILEDKYYILNKNFKYLRDRDEENYLFPLTRLTYGQYLAAYTRGVIHFLFEPFPRRVDNWLKMIAFIQVVYWYILIPFALWGLFIVSRYKWKECMVFFVYSFILVSVCALTQANIGTVFRFRDMVTPVFLLWAAVGLVKASGGRIIKREEPA